MALKVVHHKTCKTAAVEAGRKLASYIDKHKKPLLLLSGGSSLNAARVMLSRMTSEQKDRLTVAQIDGRYVPFEDSANNWHQIKDNLSDEIELDDNYAMMNYGTTPSESAADYSMVLEQLFEESGITIGLYGMGEDGHIAGILPKEDPAEFARFLDGRLVVSHKGPRYRRMTTTQEVIVRLDKAVVFACGSKKKPAIDLLNKKLPPREHPAQLFKDAKDVQFHVSVDSSK